MIDLHQQNGPARYATAGIEFIAVVGLLTGGGYWLDRRVGTLPLWTLVGFVGGFAAGLYRLVRIAGELNRQNTPPPDNGGDEEK